MSEEIALDADEILEDFHIMSENERRELIRLILDNTVNVLDSVMQEKLNKWRNIELRCGVTGESGSGKSSFINAVRSLKASDHGAAPVGVNQTTTQPTEYLDPNNPNLVYVDLPGVGTDDFPKEQYVEKVKLKKYDVFLIITATRFTLLDIWLAREIRRLGRKFFFVRTKMDIDYRNEKRDYGREKDEVDRKVRHYTVEKISDNGFDNHLYLISNPNPEHKEFPQLLSDITEALPEFKKDAMRLSIKSFSKEMITEKKKALKERVYVVSGLSAVAGAVPIPGVGGLFDIPAIMREISIYREQFGLLDEDLERYNLTTEQMASILKVLTKEGVTLTLREASKVAAKEAAKKEIKKEFVKLIPVIGPVAGFALSLLTTYQMLSSVLERFAGIAEEIMEIRFNNMMADMDM